MPTTDDNIDAQKKARTENGTQGFSLVDHAQPKEEQKPKEQTKQQAEIGNITLTKAAPDIVTSGTGSGVITSYGSTIPPTDKTSKLQSYDSKYLIQKYFDGKLTKDQNRTIRQLTQAALLGNDISTFGEPKELTEIALAQSQELRAGVSLNALRFVHSATREDIKASSHLQFGEYIREGLAPSSVRDDAALKRDFECSNSAEFAEKFLTTLQSVVVPPVPIMNEGKEALGGNVKHNAKTKKEKASNEKQYQKIATFLKHFNELIEARNLPDSYKTDDPERAMQILQNLMSPEAEARHLDYVCRAAGGKDNLIEAVKVSMMTHDAKVRYLADFREKYGDAAEARLATTANMLTAIKEGNMLSLFASGAAGGAGRFLENTKEGVTGGKWTYEERKAEAFVKFVNQNGGDIKKGMDAYNKDVEKHSYQPDVSAGIEPGYITQFHEDPNAQKITSFEEAKRLYPIGRHVEDMKHAEQMVRQIERPRFADKWDERIYGAGEFTGMIVPGMVLSAGVGAATKSPTAAARVLSFAANGAIWWYDMYQETLDRYDAAGDRTTPVRKKILDAEISASLKSGLMSGAGHMVVYGAGKFATKGVTRAISAGVEKTTGKRVGELVYDNTGIGSWVIDTLTLNKLELATKYQDAVIKNISAQLASKIIDEGVDITTSTGLIACQQVVDQAVFETLGAVPVDPEGNKASDWKQVADGFWDAFSTDSMLELAISSFLSRGVHAAGSRVITGQWDTYGKPGIKNIVSTESGKARAIYALRYFEQKRDSVHGVGGAYGELVEAGYEYTMAGKEGRADIEKTKEWKGLSYKEKNTFRTLAEMYDHLTPEHKEQFKDVLSWGIMSRHRLNDLARKVGLMDDDGKIIYDVARDYIDIEDDTKAQEFKKNEKEEWDEMKPLQQAVAERLRLANKVLAAEFVYDNCKVQMFALKQDIDQISFGIQFVTDEGQRDRLEIILDDRKKRLEDVVKKTAKARDNLMFDVERRAPSERRAQFKNADEIEKELANADVRVLQPDTRDLLENLQRIFGKGKVSEEVKQAAADADKRDGVERQPEQPEAPKEEAPSEEKPEEKPAEPEPQNEPENVPEEVEASKESEKAPEPENEPKAPQGEATEAPKEEEKPEAPKEEAKPEPATDKMRDEIGKRIADKDGVFKPNELYGEVAKKLGLKGTDADKATVKYAVLHEVLPNVDFKRWHEVCAASEDLNFYSEVTDYLGNLLSSVAHEAGTDKESFNVLRGLETAINTYVGNEGIISPEEAASLPDPYAGYVLQLLTSDRNLGVDRVGVYLSSFYVMNKLARTGERPEEFFKNGSIPEDIARLAFQEAMGDRSTIPMLNMPNNGAMEARSIGEALVRGTGHDQDAWNEVLWDKRVEKEGVKPAEQPVETVEPGAKKEEAPKPPPEVSDETRQSIAQHEAEEKKAADDKVKKFLEADKLKHRAGLGVIMGDPDKAETLIYSTNGKLNAWLTWAVIDASDINFKPQGELQERNRLTDEDVDDCVDRANNLVPPMLYLSTLANIGAPVIFSETDPDTGKLVWFSDAGEGRFRSLQIAYAVRQWWDKEGNAIDMRKAKPSPQAEAYKEYITPIAEGFGITIPKEMKHPVLVRVYNKEKNAPKPGEEPHMSIEFIAKDSNVSATAPLTPEEVAISRSREIGKLLDKFNPGENGSILVARNREFLREFYENVGKIRKGKTGTTDRTYFNEDGFTEKAERDVIYATIAYIINDSTMTKDIMNDDTGDFGKLRNALLDTAFELVKLEGKTDKNGVREKTPYGLSDIMPRFMQRLYLLRRFNQKQKDNKKPELSWEEYNEGLLPTMRETDPVVNMLMTVLTTKKLTQGRSVGIDKFFNSYAKRCEQILAPEPLNPNKPELPSRLTMLTANYMAAMGEPQDKIPRDPNCGKLYIADPEEEQFLPQFGGEAPPALIDQAKLQKNRYVFQRSLSPDQAHLAEHIVTRSDLDNAINKTRLFQQTTDVRNIRVEPSDEFDRNLREIKERQDAAREEAREEDARRDAVERELEARREWERLPEEERVRDVLDDYREMYGDTEHLSEQRIRAFKGSMRPITVLDNGRILSNNFGFGHYMSPTKGVARRYALPDGWVQTGYFDDAGMLDWEISIYGDDLARVVESMRKVGVQDVPSDKDIPHQRSGKEYLEDIERRAATGEALTPEDIHLHAGSNLKLAQKISEAFRDAGYVGHRYRDWAGIVNYVIYDGKDVDVTLLENAWNHRRYRPSAFTSDVREQITKRTRETMDKGFAGMEAKGQPVSEEDKKAFFDYVDKLPSNKWQLATWRWFEAGVIRVPEDADKIEGACKWLDKKNAWGDVTNPAWIERWRTPAQVNNELAPKPVSERLPDPDTLPYLHYVRTLGEGENAVRVYDMDNTPEAAKHLCENVIAPWRGKDGHSPWCLMQYGHENGKPVWRGKNYWDSYDACPRGIAFNAQNEPVAFRSSHKRQGEWWDIDDVPHSGVRVPVDLRKYFKPEQFGLKSFDNVKIVPSRRHSRGVIVSTKTGRPLKRQDFDLLDVIDSNNVRTEWNTYTVPHYWLRTRVPLDENGKEHGVKEESSNLLAKPEMQSYYNKTTMVHGVKDGAYMRRHIDARNGDEVEEKGQWKNGFADGVWTEKRRSSSKDKWYVSKKETFIDGEKRETIEYFPDGSIHHVRRYNADGTTESSEDYMSLSTDRQRLHYLLRSEKYKHGELQFEKTYHDTGDLHRVRWKRGYQEWRIAFSKNRFEDEISFRVDEDEGAGRKSSPVDIQQNGDVIKITVTYPEGFAYTTFHEGKDFVLQYVPSERESYKSAEEIGRKQINSWLKKYYAFRDKYLPETKPKVENPFREQRDANIIDHYQFLRDPQTSETYGYFNRATGEIVLRENCRADTLVHELAGHALWRRLSTSTDKTDQKAFAKLRELLRTAAPEDVQAVRDLYPELEGDAFDDELFAYLVCKRFTSEKQLERLYKSPEDRTWWEKFYDLIVKAWRSLVKFVGGTPDMLDLSKLSDDPEKAVKQILNAFYSEKGIARPKKLREMAKEMREREGVFDSISEKDELGWVSQRGQEMREQKEKVKRFSDELEDILRKTKINEEWTKVNKDDFNTVMQSYARRNKMYQDGVLKGLRKSALERQLDNQKLAAQQFAKKGTRVTPAQLSGEVQTALGKIKIPGFGKNGKVQGWAQDVAKAARDKLSVNLDEGSLNNAVTKNVRDILARTYELACSNHLRSADSVAVTKIAEQLRRTDDYNTMMKLADDIEKVFVEKIADKFLSEKRADLSALLEKYSARFNDRKHLDDRSTSAMAEYFLHELYQAVKTRSYRGGLTALQESYAEAVEGLTRAKEQQTPEQYVRATLSVKARELMLPKKLADMDDAEIDNLIAVVQETIGEGITQRDNAIKARKERAQSFFGGAARALRESVRQLEEKKGKPLNPKRGKYIRNAFRFGYTAQALLDVVTEYAPKELREEARRAIAGFSECLSDAGTRERNLAAESVDNLARNMLRAAGKGDVVVEGGKGSRGYGKMVSAWRALVFELMKEPEGSEKFALATKQRLSWGQLIHMLAECRSDEMRHMFEDLEKLRLDNPDAYAVKVAAMEEAAKDTESKNAAQKEKDRWNLWQRYQYRFDLEDFLGKKYLPLVDAYVESYKPMAGLLDAQSIRDVGMPLSYRGRYYVPVVRNFIQFMRGGYEGLRSRLQFLPGAVTMRTHAIKDLDETADFFEVFKRNRYDLCHYIAYGDERAAIQELLLSDEFAGFREDVAKMFGRSFEKQLTEHLIQLNNGMMQGEELYTDAFLHNGMRMVNATSRILSLGGNFYSMLKQTTSTISYPLEIGWGETLKALMELPNIVENSQAILRSKQYLARYGVPSMDVISRVSAARARGNRLPPKALYAALMGERGAMGFTQFGDKVPVVLMGGLIYGAKKVKIFNSPDMQRKIRRGELTREQAEKEAEERAMRDTWRAIDRTQQARDLQNKDAISRSRNAVLQALIQFRTSPLQFAMAEIRALEDFVARKDMGSFEHLLGVMVHNHFFEPLMIMFVNYVHAIVKDETDDEDYRWLMMTPLFVGNLDAVPGFGWMYEGFVSRLTGERFGYRSFINIPSAEKLLFVGNDVMNAVTSPFSDKEGDVEKSLKHLAREAVFVRYMEEVFGMVDSIMDED